MRLRGILAALIAAMLALSACGGDDDEGGGGGSGGDGQEVTRIKVGTLPIANAAPMYLGMEKGFFREEGLELEPQMAQSGNELITGLVGNDSQVAFLGYVPVIVARSRNLPVKVIANADNGADTVDTEWQLIMSKKGSSIREPSDLSGKTVAVNALKGVAEIGLKAALEEEGVDPNSVELLEVPFPEMPAALDAGRVDAIWAPEPFLTQVLGEGGQVVLAPYISLGDFFPNGNYATNERYLQENEDVIERFVRAMNRSTQYAAEHPDEARATIPTFTQIPEDVAQKIRLPVWRTEIDREQLADLVEYSKKFGAIEETIDVDEMVWEGATN